MAKYIKRFLRPALFAAAGAALGLVYYRLAGCEGSCPITSDPWLTAAWLGVIGLLLSAARAKNSEKDKD